MNKNWEKIDQLFHQALECPHEERAEFLSRAAEHDPAPLEIRAQGRRESKRWPTRQTSADDAANPGHTDDQIAGLGHPVTPSSHGESITNPADT